MPAPIICFVLRSRLLDNRVQLGGQEPIDVVRPGDRFRFGAAVALELGPDAGEDEKRPISLSTNHTTSFFLVFGVGPSQASSAQNTGIEDGRRGCAGQVRKGSPRIDGTR